MIRFWLLPVAAAALAGTAAIAQAAPAGSALGKLEPVAAEQGAAAQQVHWRWWQYRHHEWRRHHHHEWRGRHHHHRHLRRNYSRFGRWSS
jgi:hypothetical protein